MSDLATTAAGAPGLQVTTAAGYDKVAEASIDWFGHLKRKRDPWDEVVQTVVKYVLPLRMFTPGMLNDYKGKRIDQEVYDSTAVDAVQLVAEGFTGYMISRHSPWFKTGLALRELEELPEVKEWLDEIDQVVYDELNDSTFYQSMYQHFKDAAAIGTASLHIEEDLNRGPGKLYFGERHYNEMYIDENQYEVVDVVCRHFEKTAREIALSYNRPGDKLPETIKYDAKHNPYRPYKVLHLIYPNEKPLPENILATNKAFTSVHVLMKTRDTMRQSGFDLLPTPTWRMEKSSNETYGRSPGMDILAEIEGLNLMGRDMLEVSQLTAFPVLRASPSLEGRLTIAPGVLNYMSAAENVGPIYTAGEYNIGEAERVRMTELIRRRYRVDFFMLLAQLDKSNITATQVGAMQEEKAAMLGATIGRLEADVLDPTFDRVYRILWNAGKLPPAPPSLSEFGGIPMQIRYTGPLAQAQQRLFKLGGARRGLEQLVGIMQVRPEAGDNVNWDLLTRTILEAENMPAKIILEPGEVNRVRQENAQAVAAQEQAALLNEMGQGYKNLRESPQPRSPVQALLEGVAG